jgi:S1-C subfamily serine protease
MRLSHLHRLVLLALFTSLSAMLRFGWIALLLSACSVHVCAGPADALALQQRLIEVFEQNKDAVVRVKAAYRGPDEGSKAKVMLRVGTGFFISQEGHVLVSASRAAGASRVWVEYQGKSYATEAVGHDRLTNVSVLRVLELPDDFSIVTLDSNVAQPRLGAIAIAITCPLDFEPSPSMGIVTGIDKKLGNKVFPTEYIRTSISVDAGQGGCPILDINGRFIGMSVASITELDASYCLPVAALARVRDDLLFSGRIIHSWMGFEVAEKLGSNAENAAYLSTVIEGAPAHQAGLQEGDHLISIAGHAINDVSDVPGAVFFTRANQFTSITVKRGAELLEFSLKTLPRPEARAIIEEAEAKTSVESDASTGAVPTEPGAADTPSAEAVVALDAESKSSFFDWTTGGEPKGAQFSRRTDWLDTEPQDRVVSEEPQVESP